jgi:hypothetical protein
MAHNGIYECNENTVITRGSYLKGQEFFSYVRTFNRGSLTEREGSVRQTSSLRQVKEVNRTEPSPSVRLPFFSHTKKTESNVTFNVLAAELLHDFRRKNSVSNGSKLFIVVTDVRTK